MKLRIKGSSIRLRVLRSELAGLIETGRIAETIHFSPNDHAGFTYALETKAGLGATQLRHTPSEVAVLVPKEAAISWAETNQVGIYTTVDLGVHGALEILVEKDFACLDLSDAENQDTFANPESGAAC